MRTAAELPEALHSTFGRFLGQRVETVGDWVDALQRVVDATVAMSPADTTELAAALAE